MFSKTFIVAALVSSIVVHGAPSSVKPRDDVVSQDLKNCLADCGKQILSVTGCDADADPAQCLCKADFHNDVLAEKCTFDCLGPDDIDTVLANQGSTSFETSLNSGICGAATTPPPKGTQASQFSPDLPSCAKDCLTTENITECQDPTDTACVCNAISGDTLTKSTFAVDKCIFDSCSNSDVAIADIQLSVDCGSFSSTTPASQLSYPSNKFKPVFDAAQPGSTSSTSQSGDASSSPASQSQATAASSASKAAATPASSSTQAQASPSPSAKGNGASSTKAAGFALGLLGLAMGFATL